MSVMFVRIQAQITQCGRTRESMFDQHLSECPVLPISREFWFGPLGFKEMSHVKMESLLNCKRHPFLMSKSCSRPKGPAEGELAGELYFHFF